MTQNTTLDFYANLLIQRDELAEDGDQEDGGRIRNSQLIDCDLDDLQSKVILTQTEETIEEVWSDFKRIESQARLSLEWLRRQRQRDDDHQSGGALDALSSAAATTTSPAPAGEQTESIMQEILTADNSFDRSKCYNWYFKIQWFSDCLLLGRGELCTEIFQGISFDDLLLIEHVSIIAFEASLQALKMWNLDPECEHWHAAGDLIILMTLALKKIPQPAGVCQLMMISDEISESARLRLYGFLSQLYPKDLAQRKRIAERSKELVLAKQLTQPLMESSEDQLAGLPLLLRLFSSSSCSETYEDDLFQFILPLLKKTENLPPLIIHTVRVKAEEVEGEVVAAATTAATTSPLISALSLALISVEESWIRRIDLFQSADLLISESLKKNGYFELYDLSQLIHALTTWLVKELETDASWVNRPRGKCRRIACELCSRIIQVLPNHTFILEADLTTRMITLLARTWVVSVTQSAGCISPSQTRWKNVDQDDDHQFDHDDANSALQLLINLRKISLPRQQVGAAAGALSRGGPADLLDDILNQIISGLLRSSTFGLPIFLETPFDDLSRRALKERRKTAQIYFAANSGIIRTEDLAPYSEVYRNFNENILDYSITCHSAIEALIELSADVDETLYSKLLSYVTSNAGQALVFDSLVKALVNDIRLTRINVFSEILGGGGGGRGGGRRSAKEVVGGGATLPIPPPPLWAFNHIIAPNLWLRGVSRCRRILSSLEIGLDTNSEYGPHVSVTENLGEYMKLLKRLRLDLEEIFERESSSAKSQELVIELMTMSVRLLGNSWLARSIQDYQMKSSERSIKASCVMCLACDWVEESLERMMSEDFEDSVSVPETCDRASSPSEENSLEDFLDLHFRDDYSHEGKDLMTCQLRPELYHYIKNTFWDDRMAER